MTTIESLMAKYAPKSDASPPVKVIDGDDGSERDDPSSVVSGQPDCNDDQMWTPADAPIVREHNLDDQALISIKLGDGDSRLVSEQECDRLRDELVALRGLPSNVDAANAIRHAAAERQIAMIRPVRSVIRQIASFVGVSINLHLNDETDTLRTILRALEHHGLKVPLEPCVWLTDGQGKPAAERALDKAQAVRPFWHAELQEVKS